MDWQATLDSLEIVADLMASELGWSDTQKQENILAYRSLLKRFMVSAKVD